MKKKTGRPSANSRAEKEAAEICRMYADSSKHMEQMQESLDLVHSQQKRPISAVHEKMLKDRETEILNKMEADVRAVTVFESALVDMDVRTRAMMEDLYKNGILWDNIKDAEGNPMGRSSIGYFRRRGLVAIIAAANQYDSICGKERKLV